MDHPLTPARTKLLAAEGIAVGTALPRPRSRQRSTTLTPPSTSTAQGQCPYGWKLTGGGVAPLPSNYYGSYSTEEYALTGSYPSSTSTWRATATRVHGSYSSSSGWRFYTYSYSPRAYAICAC